VAIASCVAVGFFLGNGYGPGEPTAHMERLAKQLDGMTMITPETARTIARIVSLPGYDCDRIACDAQLKERNRAVRAYLATLMATTTRARRSTSPHEGQQSRRSAGRLELNGHKNRTRCGAPQATHRALTSWRSGHSTVRQGLWSSLSASSRPCIDLRQGQWDAPTIRSQPSERLVAALGTALTYCAAGTCHWPGSDARMSPASDGAVAELRASLRRSAGSGLGCACSPAKANIGRSAPEIRKCARSLVNLKQSSQSIIVRIVKSTPLGLDALPDIEVDLDCPKFRFGYVHCWQRFSPYPRRINAECLSISRYGFKGERPGSTLMGSVGGLRPMVGESCRSRRTKSRSLSGLLQSGGAAFANPAIIIGARHVFS
jgi:hypothetical protein